MGRHLVHRGFTGSWVVIGLLAGYAKKARSLEKVTHIVEAVTFGLE
jgi:hypothetical protein